MPISGKSYPWTENNAKNIPGKPGVYALFNKERILIYYGSSHSLRERFSNYWNTDFEGDKCKQATRSYKRELTESYKKREEELLKEYEDKHGKLPGCNERIG